MAGQFLPGCAWIPAVCVCMRAACIQYNATCYIYIYIYTSKYTIYPIYIAWYIYNSTIPELSPFCGDHPKQFMEVLGTGLAIRRLGAGPWFMAFPLVGITVSKSQCLLCFFWTLEISKSENHDWIPEICRQAAVVRVLVESFPGSIWNASASASSHPWPAVKLLKTGTNFELFPPSHESKVRLMYSWKRVVPGIAAMPSLG